MQAIINKSDITIDLIQLKGMYFVYYLLDSVKPIYIGSSKNIYKRLKCHKFNKQFDRIKLVSFETEVNCKRFERYEIQRLKPELNITAKNKYIEPQMKGLNISIESKINLINILNRN